jgi:hypothetical protein
MSGYFVVSRKWSHPQIHITFDQDGISIRLDAVSLIKALAHKVEEERAASASCGRRWMSCPGPVLTPQKVTLEATLLARFDEVVEEMKNATIHQPPR